MTIGELIDVTEFTLNVINESGQIILSINDAFIKYGILTEKFLNTEIEAIIPKANAIDVCIKSLKGANNDKD